MEHIHNYKKINEDNSGIKEICRECRKILITKKDPKTQRIDNKKYIKEHKRDTLQPWGITGKLFKKYYPNESGYISRFKK